MVKKFKELVLEKDTVFDESIEVETSIRCTGSNRFSLKVLGDIDARDITAWNIDAGDITAWNITAWNITAWNIDARDIDAGDIICESRKKKDKRNKTIARVFIQGCSKFERKEQMPEKEREQK